MIFLCFKILSHSHQTENSNFLDFNDIPIVNFASKTIPFWIRLKTVLGRSWGDLGPVLGSILAKKHWKT